MVLSEYQYCLYFFHVDYFSKFQKLKYIVLYLFKNSVIISFKVYLKIIIWVTNNTYNKLLFKKLRTTHNSEAETQAHTT